jgi:hypothetical protein
MTTGQTQTEKKAIPIVRHLHLPEKEGEEPYLEGSRCRNCGETYVDRRRVCVKCYARDMEKVALGKTGELFTFTIVHQSAPGVPVPYVAAVVRLSEGPFVTANLVDVEPKPENLRAGMKLEMVVRKVREDRAGNDIIAYQYRPVEKKDSTQRIGR